MIDQNTLVGKTLGKYNLVELLGTGGMAQVYRAIQMPLERSVAVKILHPHWLTETEMQARFLREAKAIASLAHPNIVRIYDYDGVDDVYYMAMEYLDGRSLEKVVEVSQTEGQLTPVMSQTDAIQTIMAVAQALDYAHEQGVVHRDVKPANIMQTEAGRVVLTDFGIATVLKKTRLTMEGATSGTPAYMSPEQAKGMRGDGRSDIYALGTVMYQLLTGRLPFESDTLYGLILAHINEPPEPIRQVNSALSPVLERIIEKMLAKEPEARYQTAGALVADLEALLAGDEEAIMPAFYTAETTGMPAIPSASTPQPPHKKWSWVIGSITLLAIIVAAFAIFQPKPPLDQSVDAMTVDTVASMVTDGDESTKNQPYIELFDDNELGWQLSEPPILRQVANGVYEVSVTAQGRAIAAVPANIGTYDAIIYEVEATLVAGDPESGYGLVFHYVDDQNYYVFAVNGLQQWSIWRLEAGAWRELRGLEEAWTENAGILPAGEQNHLTIEIIDNSFNLFVNGQHLDQISDEDSTWDAGIVGFYVASSRTAGQPEATIHFDNVSLQPIAGLTVPSMTTDG